MSDETIKSGTGISSERLRNAVHSVSAPPDLPVRVRNSVHASQVRGLWERHRLAAAAAVLICAGLAWQLNVLRLARNSQESYIASILSRVASIMRVGLGDHIHCAVFRSYPKAAPGMGELSRDIGPRFAGLIPIVRERVPAGYRLMLAHHCSYHGRKFVHLALTDGARILSLVIAAKGEGESFAAQNLEPVLTQAEIPVYRTGAQPFQVAALETRDHLVYVISDLPQQDNTELMQALASQVKGFLQTHLEARISKLIASSFFTLTIPPATVTG